MSIAEGTFEVTMNPLGPDEHFKDPGLARMSIDKTIQGDLVARSKGQMLSFRSSQEGSAGYVAIEKVTGVLDGRKGSFVLQHSGAMTRGEGESIVTVVPDSGTGELAGLSGRMAIIIAEGKHSYEFEFSLPDA